MECWHESGEPIMECHDSVCVPSKNLFFNVSCLLAHGAAGTKSTKKGVDRLR